MRWPLVSRRVTIITFTIVACSIAIGLVLSFVTSDPAFGAYGLVLSTIVVVIFFARSSHNELRALRIAVDGISGHVQVPDEPYVPGSKLDLLRRDIQRDVSALLLLHKTVDARGAIPAPGGWAATPDTILALVTRISDTPSIDLVVECGSGTSTAWIGLALKMRGSGRLISLEHDPIYAESSRRMVEEAGLANYVDVRHAPLEDWAFPDGSMQWYASEATRDLADISLLFVDGPPGYIGVEARYPAVPALKGRLSADCIVVLDDIDRPDELATLARWQNDLPHGERWQTISATDRAVLLQRGKIEPEQLN
ncbi:class I SAM-dependent methyltransferase [Agreia pratensis]|uniref:class I SAM-dependent methyltransferase n=1 Tax=Agreia pratensis TaxID=150121 RepID=UPI00188BA74E|nr:class I SAM-dependent methyltransferase [Agreia pratensis]MBF4633317.1 class I SAM-dependent methyltransferase [Agreia pratensis]